MIISAIRKSVKSLNLTANIYVRILYLLLGQTKRALTRMCVRLQTLLKPTKAQFKAINLTCEQIEGQGQRNCQDCHKSIRFNLHGKQKSKNFFSVLGKHQ